MADDDLIMESTTDSPEQIAEGLGVTLDVSDAVNEAIDGVEPVAEGAEEPVAEATEEVTEPEPVAEVTEHPAKVAAPRAPRGQKKSVDGAAAAARRKAAADIKVLEAENQALKDRLAVLAAGKEPAPIAAAAPPPTVAPPVVIPASAVPDTHPEVAAVLAEIAALGAKPKQADFADYDEFEEKKDAWIEQRGALRGKAESVRMDVARRASIEQAEANRAAAVTAKAFDKTVEAAKARHADYDEAMERTKTEGLHVSRDVGVALMESPIGADVMYYLASNPTEVHRINALSPARQIAEIGILEGRIAASLRQQPTTPTRPAARVTKAPDPQNVVLGDFSSAGKKKDINDPNLTLAEYNQLRNEMDEASGRRVAR